jgi:hypothetical protein
MGKLSVFMAMKRDLAFEFERELRAVRNLILGVTRVSGSEYTVELVGSEGFVAGSRARAAFVEAFRAAAHEALVKYAHDLAHECLEHGMDQEIIGGALGGTLARPMREPFEHMPPPMPHAAPQAMQPPPFQPQTFQPQTFQPMPPPVPMPQSAMMPDATAVRLAACA